MSVNQFSFGDGDSGIGGKVKPWKADINRIYRLSFMWWKGLEEGAPNLDDSAPQFAGANTHYIPGAGYVVNKGPEYTKLAGGEPPRMRIASIIAVWPTNKDGVLDKNALARGDVEILPWVISGEKFNYLKSTNNEFPFGHHDFTANCTEAQYQKMTFTPCKESLLRTLMANPKSESLVKDLIAKAQQIQLSIKDHIGREMTIQQLREKLGGAAGGAGASSVDTITSGDIDSVVDGLLDL